jgi:hypothetical protein
MIRHLRTRPLHSDEVTLLLAAVRNMPLSPVLLQGIDWDRLLYLAWFHGLSNHLAALLDAAQDIPPPALARLKRQAREETVRTLALCGELARLGRSFRKAGLAFLAFKGPAQSVMASGDPAARHIADLDIVVSPDTLPGAIALLQQLGYTLRPGYDVESAILRSVYHHAPLDHRRSGLLVEVHWQLFPDMRPEPLLPANLFARSIDVEILGEKIPTLSHEDMLLSLCMHASRHRWDRIEWVSSVAGMLVRNPIDADLLIRRARRSGGFRMLLLGLALADERFHIPLPDEVHQRLQRARWLPRLRERVYRQWEQSAGQLDHTIGRRVFHFALRDSPAAAFRFAANQVFAPDLIDARSWKLPPRLEPLYYAIHPFHIVWRGMTRFTARLAAWLP